MTHRKPDGIVDERADDGGGDDGEKIEVGRDGVVVAEFGDDSDGDEGHVVLDQRENERGPEAVEIEEFSHQGNADCRAMASVGKPRGGGCES